MFVSVCTCGQFSGPLGWAAQGTEREWPASLPPTWPPLPLVTNGRIFRDDLTREVAVSQSPPTLTPPSDALSKRPTCRGRGEAWLTPRGQRPQPGAGRPGSHPPLASPHLRVGSEWSVPSGGGGSVRSIPLHPARTLLFSHLELR